MYSGLEIPETWREEKDAKGKGNYRPVAEAATLPTGFTRAARFTNDEKNEFDSKPRRADLRRAFNAKNGPSDFLCALTSK